MIAATEVPSWVQTVSDLGIVVVVVLVVIGGLKKLWLFYWVHDAIVRPLVERNEELKADRDRWQQVALDQLGVIEETVDRTTRLVRRTRPVVDDGEDDDDPSA